MGVIEEEPAVVEKVMIAAMQKREDGLKNAKEMEKTSGFLPAVLLRETDTPVGIKISDIMTKKFNRYRRI